MRPPSGLPVPPVFNKRSGEWTTSQHMTYFSVTTKEHLSQMACHKEKIWQESVRVQTSLTLALWSSHSPRTFCYTTAATQSSHERCGLQTQSCRASAVLFCITDTLLIFYQVMHQFSFSLLTHTGEDSWEACHNKGHCNNSKQQSYCQENPPSNTVYLFKIWEEN